MDIRSYLSMTGMQSQAREYEQGSQGSSAAEKAALQPKDLVCSIILQDKHAIKRPNKMSKY